MIQLFGLEILNNEKNLNTAQHVMAVECIQAELHWLVIETYAFRFSAREIAV